MVPAARPVPARYGRTVARQGPLSLGDRVRVRGAVSVRFRFLWEPVSGRDGVLCGDRSGCGRGIVVGGAVGRGGLAHLHHLDGRGGDPVSPDLRRPHVGGRDRNGAARRVSVARADGRTRTAGVKTATGVESVMARIGFIGLGNMGLPMAQNLLKAGHAGAGFDLNVDASERLTASGGTRSNAVEEACKDAEVVITMLPAGEHVRDVYLGDGGVLAHVAPATLLIDSSTIDVETTRAVAQAAEGRGLLMVDAPVSGGVAGAEAATLTFMVGGSDEAFGRASPVLENMGKTIVHAGGPGTGQAAQICNNMILGASMIVVSEAFLLAEKLGLDAQRLFDIASKSSGQSWSMTSSCPVPGPVPTSPANRDYQAGFSAAMMLKDLKLAQAAARATRATTPLGAGAAAVYERFVDSEDGSVDFSGIIRYLRGP